MTESEAIERNLLYAELADARRWAQAWKQACRWHRDQARICEAALDAAAVVLQRFERAQQEVQCHYCGKRWHVDDPAQEDHWRECLDSPSRNENAQLRSELAASQERERGLREALEAVEFDDEMTCPWCREWRAHNDGCQRQAALVQNVGQSDTASDSLGSVQAIDAPAAERTQAQAGGEGE